MNLNKHILRLAIALPIVMISATSSFANEVVQTSHTITSSAKANTLQLAQAQPSIQKPDISSGKDSETSKNEVYRETITRRPGSGIRPPKTPKGPK
jgi:hypothetical protein